MNKQSTDWLSLFAGFVLGFSLGMIMTLSLDACQKDFQIEAVRVGAAQWIAQKDGTTTFVWKTPRTDK